ncbi:MAG: hypothetical protein HETSPECPRED_005348 [Heterodermia speciosa]|uniref:Uncharacterized protein n=1 Tax=Heterodermia speciosa TaxID=116794 RepID=A0A8H3FHE2_9LECA|nr:MAG: hypothetical protein HETSPECPRED_005348 [Heterodermia speciosa]
MAPNSDSMRQANSTKPADLGVPMSAFAARNAVKNPFIDVANQDHECPNISQSHPGAKITNVSPPSVKKQKLNYNGKQRSRQDKVQNFAAGTVKLPAFGLKRKYDSADMLTAKDDDIKHHRPISLHAQTGSQPSTESAGKEFDSEYETEFETNNWYAVFSVRELFAESFTAPYRTQNMKGVKNSD